MTGNRPAVRPARPFFSSGPCAKRPGWTLENLQGACLGRSHRSKPGKAKLKDAIERTKKLLGVPADYRLGIGWQEIDIHRVLGHQLGDKSLLADAGEVIRLGKIDGEEVTPQPFPEG